MQRVGMHLQNDRRSELSAGNFVYSGDFAAVYYGDACDSLACEDAIDDRLRGVTLMRQVAQNMLPAPALHVHINWSRTVPSPLVRTICCCRTSAAHSPVTVVDRRARFLARGLRRLLHGRVAAAAER
jgi:hypothetical protein